MVFWLFQGECKLIHVKSLDIRIKIWRRSVSDFTKIKGQKSPGNLPFFCDTFLCVFVYVLHPLLFLCTGCPAKKYIQLKMFIFEKVWNKFKQNFHSCKNISFSSFGGIYWLNILEHYLVIIWLVIAINF